MHAIPTWDGGPICWFCFAAVFGVGVSFLNLGVRNGWAVFTALGSGALAAVCLWAEPSLAQDSTADLQALVERAQARAQAVTGSVAKWTATLDHKGDAYEPAAGEIASQNKAAVIKGLGMMDDPALRQAGADMAAPARDPGALYVAVSLSMPTEDLRALARDAQKSGAQLVIRGLVNGSFKETIARAKQVFDEHSASGLAIDPQVFRAFDVKAAPTFIAAAGVVQPCGSLGCLPSAAAYDKVAGNISMEAALTALATAGTSAKPVASAALERLRG